MLTDRSAPALPERVDHTTVSDQFDHLIDELVTGKMQRGRFETWEIPIFCVEQFIGSL